MKILINIPCIKLLGGVASHYGGLKNYWTENVIYNVIGKRSKYSYGILYLPWDIVKFIFKLLLFKPDVVLLNPSMGNSALKRDFIFLNISRFLGYKVVVFIHGFNLDYVNKVDKKWLCRNFNKASMIFVLASTFKDMLQNWGVTTDICLSTTKVDDKLVENFDINNRIAFKRNILCVSRIEKEKGIYESLDAFNLLKRKYVDLTFTLVGDGCELSSVKQYINEKNIKDVVLTGRLDGSDLINEFEKASFFIFTSYGEGMPTCVLEAMAFGLPVFTRKVGGLVDFFEQDKMGYITDSLDPKDFADAIEKYLKNPDLYSEVAFYNYNYARENFMASNVVNKIEQTLKQIL